MDKSEGPIPGLREAGTGVSVIDMPGHVRLRHDMLASCAPRALGVVFVVDSSAFKKNPSDVAEYLYELLSAPALQGRPFLLLCNKQDQTWLASKPPAIKAKLEAEFDMIRDSRRAALADVSLKRGDAGASASAGILGNPVR
jgi:signal recognition particle receptor subunit beta